MNWYVKYEVTKTIDGPFTEEQALRVAGDMEGMAFSEKIFEPKFVTTEEVETLLAEMRIRANEKQQGLTSVKVKELLKQAADTIVLLSAEKVITSEEVENLLTDLRSYSSDKQRKMLHEALGIQDANQIEEFMNKAADTIVLLSAEKVIECSIQGGVFSVESDIPVGVKLEVNDYDAESYDEDDLDEDESGEACKKLEFESK